MDQKLTTKESQESWVKKAVEAGVTEAEARDRGLGRNGTQNMVKQNSAAYGLVSHLDKIRQELADTLHKPIAIQKAIATGLCNVQSLCRR